MALSRSNIDNANNIQQRRAAKAAGVRRMHTGMRGEIVGMTTAEGQRLSGAPRPPAGHGDGATRSAPAGSQQLQDRKRLFSDMSFAATLDPSHAKRAADLGVAGSTYNTVAQKMGKPVSTVATGTPSTGQPNKPAVPVAAIPATSFQRAGVRAPAGTQAAPAPIPQPKINPSGTKMEGILPPDEQAPGRKVNRMTGRYMWSDAKDAKPPEGAGTKAAVDAYGKGIVAAYASKRPKGTDTTIAKGGGGGGGGGATMPTSPMSPAAITASYPPSVSPKPAVAPSVAGATKTATPKPVEKLSWRDAPVTIAEEKAIKDGSPMPVTAAPRNRESFVSAEDVAKRNKAKEDEENTLPSMEKRLAENRAKATELYNKRGKLSPMSEDERKALAEADKLKSEIEKRKEVDKINRRSFGFLEGSPAAATLRGLGGGSWRMRAQ